MLVFVYSNVVTSMTTLVTPDVASEALVGNTSKHKGGSLAHITLSCAMCTCQQRWNYTIKAEGNIGLVCSFFHTVASQNERVSKRKTIAPHRKKCGEWQHFLLGVLHAATKHANMQDTKKSPFPPSEMKIV